MADVEGLTLASQVQVEIIDPRDVDARYCLQSYFEELGRGSTRVSILHGASPQAMRR